MLLLRCNFDNETPMAKSPVCAEWPVRIWLDAGHVAFDVVAIPGTVDYHTRWRSSKKRQFVAFDTL
jgi:hypothetical protein